MELFSAVVHALECTMLFVLATHHMMDHTYVKSATQVCLTLFLFVSYHVLIVTGFCILMLVVGQPSTYECTGFL